MSSHHHRTLRVVRQLSTVGAGCELALSQGLQQSCGRCGGCASGLLANDGSASFGIALPESLLLQQDMHPLKVGQSIEIAVPSAMLLALSSVVYLLPVALMLFFAVGCQWLFNASEGQIAVSAAVGLCLGLSACVFFEPVLRSYISKRLTLSSSADA